MDVRTYNWWYAIKRRCYDPKHDAYKYYGARGIGMHEPWRDNAWQFVDDVENEIGPRPSPKHTLDRKDNDRGYEPGNIQWATAGGQNLNKRKGERKPRSMEELPLPSLDSYERWLNDAINRHA